MTFTSSTTAEVERFEDRNMTFSFKYTITKQAAAETPGTPAAGTLNGTWRITGGTLSGSGYSANYASSSAETFTLALSDAGDGSYVLSVSGEGVSNKEGSPYVEAYFEGVGDEVRVVWGTSDDWKDWPYGDGSVYELTDTNTYSTNFPIVTHDVTSASYQLMSNSTVKYTQRGPSIHGNEAVVNVELTLERVN